MQALTNATMATTNSTIELILRHFCAVPLLQRRFVELVSRRPKQVCGSRPRRMVPAMERKTAPSARGDAPGPRAVALNAEAPAGQVAQLHYLDHTPHEQKKGAPEWD
jgi:hypothetical protein